MQQRQLSSEKCSPEIFMCVFSPLWPFLFPFYLICLRQSFWILEPWIQTFVFCTYFKIYFHPPKRAYSEKQAFKNQETCIKRKLLNNVCLGFHWYFYCNYRKCWYFNEVFSIHLLLQLDFCSKDINPAFMISHFFAMGCNVLSQTHCYDYMTISNQTIKYIPSEKTCLNIKNI